jgi:hypothetical protein
MKKVSLISNGLVKNSDFSNTDEYIKSKYGYTKVSELVLELEDIENKLEDLKAEFIAEKEQNNYSATLNSLNRQIMDLMSRERFLTKELKKPTYRREPNTKKGYGFIYIKN